MPAIVAHDNFGQDVYKKHYRFIGGTKDEYEAFLLGNQGPDPLFFSAFDPRIRSIRKLATRMHHENPNELLLSFKQALSILSDKEYPIGRAYVLGFLGHYILDSAEHPLVYHLVQELCGAGIEGLNMDYASDVHMMIESEYDEMVLFVKREQTIIDFNPGTQILRGNNTVLDIISSLYAYAAMVTYGLSIPVNSYALSLRLFRRAERALHSPYGVRREFLGTIEGLFRKYSIVRSKSLRSIALTESSFDNHEHNTWINPFTDEARTDSFWDIYDEGVKRMGIDMKALDAADFSLYDAQMITHDLDFQGEPTVAILTVEQND